MSGYISPLPPNRASQHFDGLRTEALEEIQKLAAKSWTDHNPHDPGVTIMEAFCYAMTELGMRVELDVADLIASGNRRSQAELQPAQRVLPCGPVTADDLRNVLLDHYLVGDAWLSVGVPDSVEYFEDLPSNPPLTYAASTPRVTPSGLYEVLLAFEDLNLNSNTFSFTVEVGLDTFNLDFALPHWDEPEARPFRAGGITLTNVTMLNPGNEWRTLDETLAFFGAATLAFTGPGGAGTVDTWVLMRITDRLDQSAVVIPGILAEAQTLVESTAADNLIDQFVQRIAAAEEAVSKVRRYLLTWRNLAEFPVGLAVSRIQEIAVYARVEVAGTTELENLLAEMLFALDCSLSPPVLFADLATQRAGGRSAEAIFDGPLLTHGFLVENEEEVLVREDQIFLSDVLRLIMQRRLAGAEVSNQENPSGRDIVAVTDLALSNYVNNRIITDKATGCLRLVDIARYRPRLSLAKSRIVFVRDDVEIDYDYARVETRFQELQAEKKSTARLEQFNPDWPVPAGEELPVDDYYPFQNDLPSIYGVTETGLPGSASTERRQQALQMRAYLMLFEQFLADTTEQLVNVNRFFSPSGEETTTYFTRPLLELGEMDKLVRSFTGGTSWAAFLANPDNAYARALQSAAEDEATALDRRNRMLDHLLARHGEDAVAWGQELHRWGQKSLLRTTVNLPALPRRIRARRLQVNRRLLRSKADFLAAIPELHALRLQGFGDPMHWLANLVTVERVGTDYVWRLARNGAFVFESAVLAPDYVPAATRGEALALAREVLQLAGTAAFYGAVNLGGPGNRRYVLRDGPDSTDRILAHGAVGFPNLPAANAAAVPVRLDFEALRIRESRTAMERRIDHLIGIRYRGRRVLLNPLADFFEAFDVAGPAFTKRWRLWSDTGFSGDILLVGDASFSDPAEPAAIALAHGGVESALEFAIDEWNYLITEVAPASYSLALVDMNEVLLAAAPGVFTSRADAEAARDRTIEHLYDRYSVEGFHMVETLLLRPHATGNPFLAIPISDTESLLDPYSQRLTIVLPSGYERDFAVVDAPRTPCRPHRFRDAEFRRHAERIIRQSCPAHILPDIRWIDRQAPGSAAADGSLDMFEPRFFAWLRTLLIAGTTEPALTNARSAVVSSINAIVNG